MALVSFLKFFSNDRWNEAGSASSLLVPGLKIPNSPLLSEPSRKTSQAHFVPCLCKNSVFTCCLILSSFVFGSLFIYFDLLFSIHSFIQCHLLCFFLYPWLSFQSPIIRDSRGQTTTFFSPHFYLWLDSTHGSGHRTEWHFPLYSHTENTRLAPSFTVHSGFPHTYAWE